MFTQLMVFPMAMALPPPGRVVEIEAAAVEAALGVWAPASPLAAWTRTLKLPGMADGPVRAELTLSSPPALSPAKRRYTARVTVEVDADTGAPLDRSAGAVGDLLRNAALIPQAEADPRVGAFLTRWPGAGGRLTDLEHGQPCILYEAPSRAVVNGEELGVPRLDWCEGPGTVQVYWPGDYDDPLAAGLAALRPDARLIWVRMWLWPVSGGPTAAWQAAARLQTPQGEIEVAAERVAGGAWKEKR